MSCHIEITTKKKDSKHICKVTKTTSEKKEQERNIDII